MPIDKTVPVDWESLLAGLSYGKTVAKYSSASAYLFKDNPQMLYISSEMAE